jgi:hypothetical protein
VIEDTGNSLAGGERNCHGWVRADILPRENARQPKNRPGNA